MHSVIGSLPVQSSIGQRYDKDPHSRDLCCLSERLDGDVGLLNSVMGPSMQPDASVMCVG